MDDDLRSRRRRLRGFSINRLIPNVLTLAALCSGLTAIRFGLQGQMKLAVIAIIVAAILDALDGRVARRLGVTSRFGAELDSLSDFLCFGVSPALVLYLASLKDAGALLALIPLVVSFEIEAAWPRHALVVGAVLVVVGGLMVSRLPTFSFKKGRVPRHLVLPSLLAVALMLGVIASSPWIGMSLLGLGYASLIPFSWLAYRRQATQDRQAPAAGDVVALRAVDSGQPPRD